MAALRRSLSLINVVTRNVLRSHKLVKGRMESTITSLPEYRFIYPEFLPNPDMSRRHKLREKLERIDMLNRRKVLDIPEFYVGTIMSVTVSDPNAPGKRSKFMGICIERGDHGLRAYFILRNVIDGHGVEIRYDLYNPLIQSIDVIKLEKRLDSHLQYLRDAPLEYSTFPFDMEPVLHPEGDPVPINTIKVKLNPKPWHQRWELKDLKGVQDLGLHWRHFKRAVKISTPWQKYDLMDEYRANITEEDMREVFADVDSHHKSLKDSRERSRKKRLTVRPKKTI